MNTRHPALGPATKKHNQLTRCLFLLVPMLSCGQGVVTQLKHNNAALTHGHASGPSLAFSGVQTRVVTLVDRSVVVPVLDLLSTQNHLKLHVFDVETPAYGNANVVHEKSIVYRPRSGFVGTDKFRFVVSDAQGLLTEGVIEVVVRPQA